MKSNTDKDSATFQDILLELMEANETAAKIEKNTASALSILSARPELNVGGTVTGAAVAKIEKNTTSTPAALSTPSEQNDAPQAAESNGESEQGSVDALTCCNAILKCVKECEGSLHYIAEETAHNGGMLIRINHVLEQIRDNADRYASIAALQNAENRRESQRATTTQREAPSLKKIAAPDLGMLGKIALLATAIYKAIASSIEGFIDGLKGSFQNGLKQIYPMLSQLVKTISDSINEGAAALAVRFKNLFAKTGSFLENSKIGEYISAFIKEAEGSQFIADIKLVTGKFSAAVKSLGQGLLDVAKTMGEGAMEIKAGISEGSVKLIESIKGFWTAVKSSKIGKWFSELGTLLGEVGNALGELFSVFKTAGESKGIFGKAIEFIMKLMPQLKNIGSALKGLFEHIALPLTIILSVIDTVTGFIDGFTKTEGDLGDKLIGGLKGGLTELVNGLVGGLLDLLKSTVSWIAGALGFKDVEKTLDSFKFTDIIKEMISKLVNSIIDYFKDSVFGGAIKTFNSLIDLIEGKIDFMMFIKKALAAAISAVLAPVNLLSSLAGFDLTNKILELLGLPKNERTTTKTKETPEATKPVAVAADKMRDPKILDKAAADQLNPNLPESTKQKSRELVTKSYGFTNEELNAAVERKSAEQVVSPQSEPSTANIKGAEMAAYQTETQDLKERASQQAVVAGGNNTVAPVSNSNVNSVTYNNTAQPDRTARFMYPAFGY